MDEKCLIMDEVVVLFVIVPLLYHGYILVKVLFYMIIYSLCIKIITGVLMRLPCSTDPVLWIFHNFICKHFTTNKVPAVALGIVEKGFSITDMFRMQVPPTAHQ